MHPAILKQLADMHIQEMIAGAGDERRARRARRDRRRGQPAGRAARLYGTVSDVEGCPP